MLSIKTEILKKMLSKAIKGVTNNKLLPITSLLCIYYENKTLTLRTYDGYNNLIVSKEVDTDYKGKFYVVVDANLFNSLVTKTTKDTMYLDIVDSDNNGKYLRVKGNGSYKVEIAIDNKEIIKFPSIDISADELTEYVEIKLEDLMLALDINKPSAATSFENVSITGAYFDDYIITTNQYLATVTNKNIFGKPLLLNYSTLNLLPTLSSENVLVSFSNDYIVITDDNDSADIIVEIYGKVMSEIDKFPKASIMKFFDIEYSDKVVMDKVELLKALDRLNLFISVYDKNILKLSFAEDGLNIYSVSGSGSEHISYNDETEGERSSETCYINYHLLKTQLQATKSDMISIIYGNSPCILIEDELASFIVALSVLPDGEDG